MLDKLARPARVYMANGRFSEVTPESAVFALPDAGLLARAAAFQAEAEAALEAHFGRRVPLHLVLDCSAPPVVAAAVPPEPADDVTYDLAVFEEATDAPDTVLTPEQRLLEAFPGAVLDG